MGTLDLSPMLAVPSTAASNRQAIDVTRLVATGDWAVDLKMDGIRAYCHWDDGVMRLVNRKGVDISRKYPEITACQLPHDHLWLDGEIVAEDGSFETVLTRDKQESNAGIKRGANLHPCRFVAFDLPGLDAPWTLRREVLVTHSLTWSHIDQFSITPCSESVDFVEQVAQMGLEGVIVKRKNARYQFGGRSTDWVKHKNTHRLSFLVAGYTAGEGSREHFGALILGLVDEDGHLVTTDENGETWRVGSGFSVKDTHMLKRRIDAGETLIVEVELLNRTSGGALRFPVYRGIRSDVEILDCTTAQLATLPTC